MSRRHEIIEDNSTDRMQKNRLQITAHGKSNSLAQSHETFLNDISLGLSEGSSAGQPVDGVQHRVDHDGPVVSAGEQKGTLGDEGQHGQREVAVQSQGHLCGAESRLVGRDPFKRSYSLHSKDHTLPFQYKASVHMTPLIKRGA